MLHGRGCLGDILHLSDVLDFAEGGHHILAVLKVKLSLDDVSVLHQGKAALEGVQREEEVGRVAMPWGVRNAEEKSTHSSLFKARGGAKAEKDVTMIAPSESQTSP